MLMKHKLISASTKCDSSPRQKSLLVLWSFFFFRDRPLKLEADISVGYEIVDELVISHVHGMCKMLE
jgi:hypothetical protein